VREGNKDANDVVCVIHRQLEKKKEENGFSATELMNKLMPFSVTERKRANEYSRERNDEGEKVAYESIHWRDDNNQVVQVILSLPVAHNCTFEGETT